MANKSKMNGTTTMNGSEEHKVVDKVSKKRKLEDTNGEVTSAITPIVEPEKEKKSKKSKTENGDEKKKKKKSKKSEETAETTTNTTTTTTTEEMNIENQESEKKVEVDSKTVPDASGNPPLTNFRISPTVVQALYSRNITHMFPIQAKTFDQILNGKDVVGRARTGTGKTLAFALPVIEQLQRSNDKQAYGRHARVLVLAPTRELASQIAREFETTAPRLSTLCVYGGASYETQGSAMKRGLDVIVGTCGRIKDHIERKALHLDQIQHIILDEADEMLNMGFADDVETILQSITRSPDRNVQTLLFSATLPSWVQQVSRKYLKKDHITVDLVGSQKQQAATTVRHLCIPMHYTERNAALKDVIQCYGGKQGSTIVFVETKKDANEIAISSSISQDCQALHGDIAQQQRETTLKGFRTGKFKILVATDVAARGLDITGVDLVVQIEPPEKSESYIHRAGRTGRAGKTGVCITFFTPKQLFYIQSIEKRAGIKLQRIGVPQPIDLVKSSIDDTIESLDKVHADVLPYFAEAATKLLESKDPQQVVASCLAMITGCTEPLKSRSLLCSLPGWVTVQLTYRAEIHSLSFVWSMIRRFIYTTGNQDDKVRGMKLLNDKNSAVFDIPEEDKGLIEKAMKATNMVTFSLPETLPELKATPVEMPAFSRRFGGRSRSAGPSGGGGGYGGGYGGGRGGGYGGGRGRR